LKSSIAMQVSLWLPLLDPNPIRAGLFRFRGKGAPPFCVTSPGRRTSGSLPSLAEALLSQWLLARGRAGL
jgi:hypothetical protein